MKPADVEDLYALSPLQQGMLFHVLAAPRAGLYCEQLVCDLEGELDAAAMERAWQEVVERHPVLRTSFIWRGVREPVQVVHRRLMVPLALHDWRTLPAAEQGARLRELLAAGAERGFDLGAPPLLRLDLIALGPDRHQLVWSYPHILLDGWSLPLVLGEAFALYAGCLRGEQRRLPPRRPYRDYIVWLQQRDAPASSEYWRRELAGLPGPTDIGLAPAGLGGRRRDVALCLDAASSARLQALARSNQLTLNTLAVGAWALLLARYSGRDDVVFGVTLSGRPPELAGVAEMVGLFINTVPLRAATPPADRLLPWLRRLQAQQAELLQHGHAQLVDVQRWSGAAPGRPLFETLLICENYPLHGPEASDQASLRLAGVRIEERSNYPVVVAVAPGRELALRVFFDDERCAAPLAGRLLGHLAALLTGFAAKPAATLSELPMLTAPERHQLLRELNDTCGAPAAEGHLLHRRFAAWAARAPDRAALAAAGTVVSYGELAARVERLAGELHRLGVGPEAVVGIHLERSPQLPAAVLAVLRAGGALLPLAPGYPGERLAFMLRDAAPAALLTETRLAAGLPPIACSALCVDAFAVAADGAGSPPPPDEVLADNLAYVIYTSGSTGVPKGVEVGHRGLANLAGALAEQLGLAAPGDRVLQFAAASFDVSFSEICLALGAGATLVVAPDEALLPGPNLLRLLQEQDVSVLSLPPSALAVMPGAAPAGGEPLPALRCLVVAGEACAPALVERWAAGRGFWNAYGPTETTVYATTARCAPGDGRPAIGRPLPNLRADVLGAGPEPAPLGCVGELTVGGVALARGYRGRPDLTAERFVPDPWGDGPGARRYRTGDLARRRSGGELEFLGRADRQVKLRGYRIELEEIETVLGGHPGVGEAAVVLQGGERLVGFWVAAVAAAAAPPAEQGLRAWLRGRLPGYMVPGLLVRLPALPLTPAGKVDRAALPLPALPRAGATAAAPAAAEPGASPWVSGGSRELERLVAGIWSDLLGTAEIAAADNFFERGGHSLMLLQVHDRLQVALSRDVDFVDLLRYPTVTALAGRLAATGAGGGPAPSPAAESAPARQGSRQPAGPGGPAAAAGGGIAIVGLAGRFPGARDLDELWRNLRGGVESITFFSPAELAAAGVDPALLADPAYVGARGVLEDAESFDAGFFGFSPMEAQLLDPQQRLWLECAWHALEDAGWGGPGGGAVAVFGGASISTYLGLLYSRPDLLRAAGHFPVLLGNDKDFLPTRASYKLDLRGPSVSVQTACSTSLVAVHLACQSLQHRECDLALAGGVSVQAPRVGGYLYQPAGIYSPDGHTRTFDERAAGTLPGEGVGIAVLKRLDDALAAGDRIRAVIRGSAINNDGSDKLSYTAPSVAGQAQAIAAALDAAGVPVESVGYVEAHGTATPLGDAIEVAALKEAFGSRSHRRGFCGLGAIKSNIGHLDAAAGIAGLIKTVLAMQHRELPPTLHFQRPNPKLGLAESPFYVNHQLRPWPAGETPRRAGVSAFGLGGTNVHVVLEEAPREAAASGLSRPWQLLLVSAANEAAREAVTDRLAERLAQAPPDAAALADVAFTTQVGRRHQRCRRVLVAAGYGPGGDGPDRGAAAAAAALAARRPGAVFDGTAGPGERPVAFMFSGVGDQYPGVAREIYEHEPVFRAELDRVAELLAPRLGCDLRTLLVAAAAPASATTHGGLDLRALLGRGGDRREGADGGTRGGEPGGNGGGGGATAALARTRLAQPAVFALEIALARLWRSWGVAPRALIGYSLGELTAACTAGVLELADAAAVVAERARLIDALPPGVMLAVPLGEAETAPLLGDGLALAAVHGPRLCILAGPPEALPAAEARLAEAGVVSRRIETTHAFHSPMMEAAAAGLSAVLRGVRLRPPAVPFVSNLTGTWITAAQATDPEYWVHQMCRTVRLAAGLGDLMAEADQVLLEVGPGQALSTTALQHPACGGRHLVLASMRDRRERQSDLAFLLQTLGRLWLSGVPVDWSARAAPERRRKVPLPLYPFQRRRFWVEPGPAPAAAAPPAATREAGRAVRRPDPGDWLYVPSWRRTLPPRPAPASPATSPRDRRWLIFADAWGVGAELATLLAAAGCEPALVRPAPRRGAGPAGRDREHEIDPRMRADYTALIEGLAARDRLPGHIVHLWGLHPESELACADSAEELREIGCSSLIWLAQALGHLAPLPPLRLTAVASGLHSVLGDEVVSPDLATLAGPCLVIPRELPEISCRSVDLRLVEPSAERCRALAVQLHRELTTEPAATDLAAALGGAPVVAYRGAHRWVRELLPAGPRARPGVPSCLRQRGVYLVTGGLGGMGLAFSGWLARTLAARLALVQRSPLPPRETWDDWLAKHGPDDAVSRKLRALFECEAAGGEVLVIRADVSDAAQAELAVAATRERFGRIDGVLHTAGVPGGGLIQGQEPARIAAVLAPKVAGTRILAQALAGEDLDCFVLCSSLLSLVGLPDRVEYSAANAFLDAFAQARAGRGRTLTVAINWDSWYGTTMGLSPQAVASGVPNWMSPDEGVEVLLRALELGVPQVVVSTLDPASLSRGREDATPDGAGEAPRAGRAHPRPQLATPFAPPRNDVERVLAEIWGDVLGIDRVGIHDRFLELGGDSILSLQVIARARRADLHLSLAQVYAQPTVAELAAVAGSPATAAAEQGDVTGAAPLTPIQSWFFAQPLRAPHHWNQALLLALRGGLAPAVLARAVASLVRHHDALRLRFAAAAGGGWQQAVAPPGPAGGREWVHVVLTALPPPPLERAQAAAAAALQASLDLGAGPVFRAVLFDRGAGRPSRLLLLAHHLVVDAISWRILVEDLEDACAQLARREAVRLPSKTTSYKEWAHRLADLARSESLAGEAAAWLALARSSAPPLPVDMPEGANTVASRRSLRLSSSPDETAALRLEVPRLLHADLTEILLSALAAACARWCGRPALLVDLEGHGREPLFADVDLSRTVGWFTTLYPVLLDLEGALADPAATLQAVGEQLRALPGLGGRGAGYGLLRFLGSDAKVRQRLAAPPGAEVVFVYLGQIGAPPASGGRRRGDEQATAPPEALLAEAPETAGPLQSPHDRRSHLLEVSAVIAGERLETTFGYSAGLHLETTIAGLANAFAGELRALVEHCRTLAAAGDLPLRFPQAALSPGEIDDLVARLEAPEL
jgi:polyketide synthase PksJ